MGVVRNDNIEIIMSKTRTSPVVGRLSPRRIWSPRSKSQTRNANQATWTPQKGCCWMSRNGQQVTLTDSHLTSLTEAERIALRQVALAKLQALNLGCHITLPKERSIDAKPKKRPILLKKRAVTTGFFAEKKADKDVADRAARGMVFGVPLAACVHHERQKASGLVSRSKSTSVEELARSSIPRSSSRASFTLLLDPRDDRRLLGRQETQSYESLDLEPLRRNSLIGLADAFGLRDSSADGENSEPHVPDIVYACARHLESYGLHTLGIFRVSSSRKRIRQLREEFDSGQPIELGSLQCPHDVATLLKEYFRDLPEPLLTRELYPAYVSTQKIKNRKHQLPALRYLIQLLPIPNGDTLWVLLQFLARVALNAADHRNASGDWVPGNKMDSNNLATLFGPNILHTVKNTTGGEREFVVLAAARAEERIDVINAVRCMIDSYKEIYHVPAEDLNEAYKHLYDKDSGLVEYLMNCRHSLSEIDADFDTSSSLPEGLDVGNYITVLKSQTEVSSVQNGQEKTQQEKKNSNKKSEETSSSKSEGSVASRLFRRRDKSSSRPQDESVANNGAAQARKRESSNEEGSAPVRWFRRRDRSTTKNLESAINAVHQDGKSPQEQQSAGETQAEPTKPRRSRERNAREPSPSRARPLTVSEPAKSNGDVDRRRRRPNQQQISVVDIRKEHLIVPDARPAELDQSGPDNNGVISASLTLKVPTGKVHASSVGAVTLRMDDRDIPYIEDIDPDQELESSGGSSSSRSRGVDKKHHGCSPFITSHYAGSAEPEPPPRNRSGLRKPHYSQDSVLSSEGASSVSASEVTSPPGSLRHTPSSDFGCASSFSGSSTPLSTGSPTTWQWSQSTPASPGTSPVQKRVVSPNKVETRRPSGPRTSGQAQQQGEWPQETWKRWEIISSEHTEQETLV